ncbi:hypothetical protein TEU_03335 [Thermococcus eurythermalis]|uniref:Uncharacterized protein n=1 Tax=Thermococcus eurythermalis TaxID=1505907 RepID=A0A097QSL6_9EURY|nr:hypothetical protein [Thermococcus eurythermalis]AIU69456.1 hypothetical protein TEU_03335 [Thermococcus eurythermalis]
MGYKRIVRASYSKNLNKAVRHLKSLQSDRKKVLKFLEQGEKELLRKAERTVVRSEADKRRVEKLFLIADAIKIEIDKAQRLGLLTNAEANHYKLRYSQLKEQMYGIIKDNTKKVYENEAEQKAEAKATKFLGHKIKSPMWYILKNEFKQEALAEKRKQIDEKEELVDKAKVSAFKKLRDLIFRRENEEGGEE